MPLGLVLLEPVRSAEPPIISGTAAVKASSALSDAARVAISFGAAASFSFTARTAAASLSFGSSPAMRRSNSARWSGGERLEPLAARPCAPPCARWPAARHSVAHVGGHLEGAAPIQPSLSRAPLISSAPSGEPWHFSVPALVGAPKPIMVRQAISDGRSERLRLLDRGRDRVGIVAVDAGRRPARRLEPLHLVDRIGQRQRAVDRDAVVVEQHDQLGELQVSGERDRLLADAFHQVAVGGEHIGVMVDDVVAELGGEMPLGDRHADRIAEPLAERPGGGLDARRDEVLRMTGRDRAELAEALDLLDRHLLVAEQMEQRVDQHRAVAGREHEAVAVGPGRIGRIELQEAREQHGRDVGRAHRQAGMAGFRLLDRVHRERADGVRHAVVQRTRRFGRSGIAACGGRRNGCRGGGEGRRRAGHAGAKRVARRASSTRARGVKERGSRRGSPCTNSGGKWGQTLTESRHAT